MNIFGWFTNGIKAIRGCINDIRLYIQWRKFIKDLEDEPNSAWYNLKLKRNKLYTIVYRDVDMPPNWGISDEMKLRWLTDASTPMYHFFTYCGWAEMLTMVYLYYFDETNPQNEVYTYRIEFEFMPNWLGLWKTAGYIWWLLFGLGVIATGITLMLMI